jgi:hypothetical protein
MSMTIDIAKVRSVLLADGWHRVAEKSFGIDAYVYGQAGAPSGGNGTTATIGFRFKDDAGYVLSGPLSAILATQASS